MVWHGVRKAGLAGVWLAAWATLIWERLWPALWPASAVAGLFVAWTWLGLFEHPWIQAGGLALHLAILALFTGSLLAGLAGSRRRWNWPDGLEALHRLEQVNGLAHRPLLALVEPSASDDPLAVALWRAHQQRIAAGLKRLRPGWPRSTLPALDRRGLRAIVGLFLVTGYVVAGPERAARLEAALFPRFPDVVAEPVLFDAWLAPPAATGLPPFSLKAQPESAGPNAATLLIPAGSLLTARVHGGPQTPMLFANGSESNFAPETETAWLAQTEILTGDRVEIRQGRSRLATWPVVVAPDAQPSVALLAAPSRTPRGAIRLDWEAQDDWGLTGLAVNLILDEPAVLAGNPAETQTGIPLTLAAPENATLPRALQDSSLLDLTAHPWAGLWVRLRLVATDTAGQQGESDSHRLIIPEREFQHPVARMLVAQRRLLTREGLAAASEVAAHLDAQSRHPADFGHASGLYLGLRVARAHVLQAEDAVALDEARRLLWDLALHLEDGGVSVAEQDLRTAREALASALAGRADAAELERLTETLRDALNRYLDALEQQMQAALARGESVPLWNSEQDGPTLERQDLERLLDQMAALSRSGARSAAEEMLKQLQAVLEGLHAGLQPDNRAIARRNADIDRAIRALQDLGRQQGALLDETFQTRPPPREAAPEAPPPATVPSRRSGRQTSRREETASDQARTVLQDLARRQGGLRQGLGERIQQLDENGIPLPPSLGRADQAMRQATQALDDADGDAAMEAQSQALESLRESLTALAEELRRSGNAGGTGFGVFTGPGSGAGRDPLGRLTGGGALGGSGDVSLPESTPLQRTRAIIDELRRRSGERHRPQHEREYLDRLLHPF